MTDRAAGNLDQYLGAYLARLNSRSEHTVTAYRRDIESFLRFMAASRLSDGAAIDEFLVRDFVAEQHRAGKGSRSLARGLSALRGFFDYLIEHKQMRANPAREVRAPKGARKLPNVLDVDQTARLMDRAPKDDLELRDLTMWELLYSCGLRVAELVALDCDSVDLGAREARVLGKGRKERVVPVGRLAVASLRRWMGARATLVGGDEAALFVGRGGTRLGVRTVQQRLRAWALRQGLDTRVHPHMLRHSFASHVLESSGDLRAVQELLGHSNISTTQVYTHLDFQYLAKVYDAAHPRARRKE